MKKTIIILFTLCISISAFSQEKKADWLIDGSSYKSRIDLIETMIEKEYNNSKMR